MTKNEIVSELVRLALHDNSRLVSMRRRGVSPEWANALCGYSRDALMGAARTVKEAMTLRDAEMPLREACASSCTDWASEPDEQCEHCTGLSKRLLAYRAALKLVIQEILRVREAEIEAGTYRRSLAPKPLPFGYLRLALPLTISREEHAGLHALASRERVSITRLLEAFIADVTGSWCSGGSDERDYADAWVKRRGFSWSSAGDDFVSLHEDRSKISAGEIERRWGWNNRWIVGAWAHREAQQRHWKDENAKREAE